MTLPPHGREHDRQAIGNCTSNECEIRGRCTYPDACRRTDLGLEDVRAGDERLAGVLDGTFAVGDGTAQREIERLRAEVDALSRAWTVNRAKAEARIRSLESQLMELSDMFTRLSEERDALAAQLTAERLNAAERQLRETLGLPQPTDEVACTGTTARWCPRCGDCTCGPYPADLDEPTCPLHGSRSISHSVLLGIDDEAESLVGKIVTESMPEPTTKRYLTKPTCPTCNDTHRMTLNGRYVMCTRCPIPCDRCHQRPQRPYCATTPCNCYCHLTR